MGQSIKLMSREIGEGFSLKKILHPRSAVSTRQADPHARKDRIMSVKHKCLYEYAVVPCSQCKFTSNCTDKAHKPAPECKGQVGVERIDGRPEANISEDSDRFTACRDARPVDSAIDKGGEVSCPHCGKSFKWPVEYTEHRSFS